MKANTYRYWKKLLSFAAAACVGSANQDRGLPSSVDGKEDIMPASDIVYAEPQMRKIKGSAAAPKKLPGLSIWDEEHFQKRFMASYGVNSDIEPRLTSVESEQMQKILHALSKDDNMEKAMKLLRKNCGDSTAATFEFTLGSLYFQQRNLTEALAWYGRALRQFPDFRRAHQNTGMIHVRNEDFDQALPHLTRTIELGGHNGIAYGLLGFACASIGNHLCAESAYRQAVLLNPDTLDWQLGLARSLFKQQKFGDAAALCDALIQKNPVNRDFWLLQANAYLGLKQPMRAAENYEYVDALGKATVQSMTMLADIYVNESLWDLAAEAYIRACELDTARDPARPLRAAGILAARGALEESKRLLNRADERKKKLDAESLKKLLKLQARVSVLEGSGEEAVKLLEEVVQNDPLDGEALILLGQHYGRKKPEKAVFYYERAAGIKGHEMEAKLRHGQLLVRQSKYRDAVPFLRRAFELKPRSDVEEYLKQVERIAKTQR